ncbi:hypothetical protein [Thiohalorhabdus sp.]|uniref:hypothetical protein n=1 Tax=Thiohalorhabdus sp. TaxID=3094134 RepID=UPI002FC35827
MSQAPLFAYAGARLLVRHGQRPGAEDWQRLEGVGDFGHYLQIARDTGLERFVRHIGNAAGPHEVERALSGAWRRHVQEVAAWQPGPWRPALRWLAVASELPALSHLAEDRPMPDWMTDLPLTGTAMQHSGTSPLRALTQGAATPLFKDDRPAGDSLWQRALRHWHTLLPSRPRRFRTEVEGLASALEDYRQAVAAGSPNADAHLARILRRSLRQHSQEPAAAYAYLGLVALDLQRLRGELLVRRLLPVRAA